MTPTTQRKANTGQHRRRRRSRNQTAPGQSSPKLRLIPLGGMEEVGRNSMILEYGKDILIIDLGLQFPEEDMPGVDYSIPNISYLKGKEKNVRGILITHGHYDHIGGVPHLVHKLGNPTIYGSDLTLALIKKKQEDINPQHKLRLVTVKKDTKLKIGPFRIEFVGLSHNIPASFGIIIHTPLGPVMHTGDFKIDHKGGYRNETDIQKIERLKKMRMLALMCDSTNAPHQGHQLSESEITQNLEEMFKRAKGRIIFATFASLLTRIQQIVWLAEKHNRKVQVEGFSMRTNIEIAKQLGYLKSKKNTFVKDKEAAKLPDSRRVILSTGAQGEERAVLMRMANGEHKYLKIQKGDLVVFSSSVVPGNERAVQRLKDGLFREGADVYDNQMLDIHAGGHAKSEDLRWFIRTIRPQYFIPIEGNHSFLRMNARYAMEEGMAEDHVLVADNGQVIEFTKQGGKLTKEYVPTDHVFVDGLGVGDVSHVVLRDRKHLSADGMVLIVATVDGRTGRPLGKPDIITRGFIFPQSNQQLLNEIRKTVQGELKDTEPKTQANEADLRNKIRKALEKLIFKRIERTPMILPVIIVT
ncbi:MAG: ribonuclease J [Candidatus Nomurabacteria bacterium]|nr:MAG: ribonuclease J [Candidatus Nomurabacteria bacterium]